RRPPPEAAAPPRPAEPREGAVLAHLIVLLALVLVGEHGVRLGDLLEPLGRRLVVRVRVRVVLLGELPVCLLDLVRAGVLRHPERPVEVLRRCWHNPSRVRISAPPAPRGRWAASRRTSLPE